MAVHLLNTKRFVQWGAHFFSPKGKPAVILICFVFQKKIQPPGSNLICKRD